MAHKEDNRDNPLAQSEGEWIADVLRVWDDERREWSIRSPITIRLEPMDLIIYIKEDGSLGWQTNPPSQPKAGHATNKRPAAEKANPSSSETTSNRPTHAPRTAKPGASPDVYEMDGGKPSVSYEFIRFPSLSQAVGARIKRATAMCEGCAAAPKTDTLEFTLDTNAVLKLSLQKDGALLARLAPKLNIRKGSKTPRANIPLARHGCVKVGQ